MRQVEAHEIEEIRKVVYGYFADECDVDPQTITDNMNVIRDLEGDSLMLLSLLEVFRKKYDLSIDLKTLGKHLMRRPAETIGQIVELTTQIVRHGNDIINVEL